MRQRSTTRLIYLAGLLAVTTAVTLTATAAGEEQEAQSAVRVDFNSETEGAPSKAVVPVVGNWRIARDGDNLVLVVDGSKWKKGEPAAGIADRARALYGETLRRVSRQCNSLRLFSLRGRRGVRRLPRRRNRLPLQNDRRKDRSGRRNPL